MFIDISKGLSKKELKTPVKYFVNPVDTVFDECSTIQQVLDSLRSKKIRNQINYFYAVDYEKRLTGVVSTRSLLFHDPHKQLFEIMDSDVIHIYENTPLEQALKIINSSQLLALPIVDADRSLQGILEILPQELKYINDEEHKNRKIDRQIFHYIGLSLDQIKMQSSLTEYRYRMPWLICNIFGGLMCAIIANFFRLTLANLVILAMFIPLILTLCESIAMQSMTLSLQMLQQKNEFWSKIGKRILKEWQAAFYLGVTCAFFVGISYFILSHEVLPLLVILTTILITMILSATFGTAVPILLNSLKWDPKVASGPLILMLTDIAATTIYLGIATFWLMP